MCYSEEQSRKSFVINMITCYVLFTYNTSPTFKIIALFFAFVGIMQFLDIIFWNNQNIQDPRQAQVNWITTKVAMVVNHLQPIILAYLIYIYKGSLGKLSNIILPIYIIAISIYSFNSYNKIKYTLQEDVSIRDVNDLLFVNPEDDYTRTSLKWDWNIQRHSLIVYIIFLSTLLILAYENFSYPFNIVLAFINIFTFVLSAYYYKGRSLGRFWCKFAAWVPLFFILIHKFIDT
jgi:hypothetical protein